MTGFLPMYLKLQILLITTHLLQDGHIFIADYKILEKIPTNTIKEKKQYLAAPMCLLWKNPQDQLVPIAIQVFSLLYSCLDHHSTWTEVKLAWGFSRFV